MGNNEFMNEMDPRRFGIQHQARQARDGDQVAASILKEGGASVGGANDPLAKDIFAEAVAKATGTKRQAHGGHSSSMETEVHASGLMGGDWVLKKAQQDAD